MKKLLILLVLIGLSFIIAATFIDFSHPKGQNGYEYDTVAKGSSTETVTATGPLEPADLTIVGSVLPGEVVKVEPGADFNRQVNKGDILLELDDRMARQKCDEAEVAVEMAKANIAQAEAAIDQARATIDQARARKKGAEVALQYQRDLFNMEGVGKRSDLEKAEFDAQAANAGVKAAEAGSKTAEAELRGAKAKKRQAEETMRQAKLNLDLTKVPAPVSGTIIDRHVTEGQVIAPPASANLFTIARDLSHLQVHTKVPEGDISKIHRGQPASFTVYAYSDGNVKFPGKVTEVYQSPIDLQGAVHYVTLVDVDNQRDLHADPDPKTGQRPWMLRPGMTATVEIQCRQHNNIWKIPNSALDFQLDQNLQTPEARAKIAEWQGRPDNDHWKLLWIMGQDHKPWPVFARTLPASSNEQPGISDDVSTEVLEWDADPLLKPLLEKQEFQIVKKAPPSHKAKFFEKINVKF